MSEQQGQNQQQQQRREDAPSITLMGTIGQAAEARQTPNGRLVVEFTVFPRSSFNGGIRLNREQRNDKNEVEKKDGSIRVNVWEEQLHEYTTKNATVGGLFKGEGRLEVDIKEDGKTYLTFVPEYFKVAPKQAAGEGGQRSSGNGGQRSQSGQGQQRSQGNGGNAPSKTEDKKSAVFDEEFDFDDYDSTGTE